MQFDKSPLTIPKQIDLLMARGLLIPDREKAAHYLTQINYYRLVAYWLTFEASRTTHQFVQGTAFDKVLNL